MCLPRDTAERSGPYRTGRIFPRQGYTSLGLGVMPAYGHDDISTEEVNDLLAYIRSSRLACPPLQLLR
jgi:hypothetical protein